MRLECLLERDTGTVICLENIAIGCFYMIMQLLNSDWPVNILAVLNFWAQEN